jgi:hypothetical protein
MKHIISALIFGLVCGSATAHELTPTYPEFRPSFMDGISVTTLELYNAREEIQFYRINVYTAEWEAIPFATKDSTIRVPHNQRRTFEVYIKDRDLNRAEYICTISRYLLDQVQSQGISSRVCSRVK